MKNVKKSIIKEKRIECVLGILFLIPPILGVFFFMLSLCGINGDFVNMRDLSGQWDWHSNDGVSMSPAPLYLGLMAIAGVYLIKNSLRYLFLNNENLSEKKDKEQFLNNKNSEKDYFKETKINDFLGINNTKE